MDYGRPVQFGVFVTPDATDPKRPLETAILADELGFDLIGVQDHPYQRRFYDAFTLLTAIAMRTKRATVFPDVANLPLRPPAVMAKAAASIDLLSGGASSWASAPAASGRRSRRWAVRCARPANR